MSTCANCGHDGGRHYSLHEPEWACAVAGCGCTKYVSSDEMLKHMRKALAECVEALDDLTDVQNGPPLISYTDDWNKAMSRSLDAICQARSLLNNELPKDSQ